MDMKAKRAQRCLCCGYSDAKASNGFRVWDSEMQAMIGEPICEACADMLHYLALFCRRTEAPSSGISRLYLHARRLKELSE
jgi:hypothetical protein